jgi:hypothetical protein
MNETNEMIDYNLTCHTEGCQNCDIPIILNAPAENVYFVCGPCCNEITDFYIHLEINEQAEEVTEQTEEVTEQTEEVTEQAEEVTEQTEEVTEIA